MTTADATHSADDDPGPDATFGVPRDDITTELLTLCDEFFRCHATPAVHTELRAFLIDHGYHPAAGLGAFLDALGFAREADG